MFRQREVHFASWHDKTVEVMQKSRFDQAVAQLPPLGADRLSSLPHAMLEKRIEKCWQDVERKPMRNQQLNQAKETVLGTIKEHADCLSIEEHELIERTLILGGRACIEDASELDAAKALSLRLWADVGLVSGQPYIELDRDVAMNAEKVFASDKHGAIRARFGAFCSKMQAMLNSNGIVDDRIPQKVILNHILDTDCRSELYMRLARLHLWAGFDCLDYSEGVLLIHSALADPGDMIMNARRRSGLQLQESICTCDDVYTRPQENLAEKRLEHTLTGALRTGRRACDVARSLRYLCKQGAPLHILREELQHALIIHVTEPMVNALGDMFFLTPKWIECSELAMYQ